MKKRNIGLIIGLIVAIILSVGFGAVFGGIGGPLTILIFPMLLVGKILASIVGPVGQTPGTFFTFLLVGWASMLIVYGVIGYFIGRAFERR